jgi:protein-S-isoprenylcysteine O-methyltransferase Ste14
MVKLGVKIVGTIVGALFLTLGCLGIPFSILAIIDPVGSKAADDADPLGVPPTFLTSVGILGLYIVIAAVGAALLWLCWRRRTQTI